MIGQFRSVYRQLLMSETIDSGSGNFRARNQNEKRTRHAGWRLLLTVPCFLLTTVAVAEEPRLKKAVEDAAEEIVEEVRRDDYQYVLIAIRSGVGSQSDASLKKILEMVRSQITTLLQAENLSVVASEQIDRLIAEKPAKEPLLPEDIAEFRKLEEIEVAVIIELRRRGRQRWLNLELIDNLEAIWKEKIRLPNAGFEARKQARSQQANRSQGAGSRPPAAGTASNSDGTRTGNRSSVNGTAGRNGSTPENRAGEAGEGPPRRPGASSGVGPIATVPGIQEVANATNATSLNLRVLQFAISQMGKQVGNGECWTLADQALRAAGAQPARGYTFGTRIPLNTIGPGDILQFTSVRIDVGNMYFIFGLPNHTAVVHSVDGNSVRILHQNFGKKIVTAFEFDISQVTSGTIEAYRPVAN